MSKTNDITEQDVSAQREVIEKSVTKEQLVREFGEQGLVEKSDGSWEYNLPKKNGRSTKRVIQKAMEMDRPRALAEVKACDSMRAHTPTETIRDGSGNKVEVPAHMAETLDRRFFEQRRRR